MKLTWVGAMMPAALLTLIWDLFNKAHKKSLRKFVWLYASIITLGGFSPWCLVKITQYIPDVQAIYGPLEPILRIRLCLVIIAILWNLLGLSLFGIHEKRHRTLVVGFFIYGFMGLFATSQLPLFGNYFYLESASYGSVIWTTLAVWHTFKELQDQNRNLTELDEMKKNFINHVTHEFRTPLNAIDSATSILSDTGSSGSELTRKQKDYIKMIQKNAERLKFFVDDLLDLAALQKSKIQLHKSQVSMNDVCAEAIQLHQSLAESAHIQVGIQGENVSVKCDRERIRQVISNLLSNAIKATQNEDVVITVSQTNSHANISIKDDGSGIKAEDLQNIFSPFFKVETKSAAQKGSGLGLAIAKAWVEAHIGKIWAESEGRGMIVSFTLPEG